MGGKKTVGRTAPLSGVRAVFFDAGNTLLRAHPSVGHLYAKTARHHGVRVATGWVEERFQAAWRDRHKTAIPRNDRGEKAWWRRLVSRVFDGRLAGDRFRLFFEDLYGRFARPEHWRYFPDALPTLRALRAKGLRVGVVSNWDSRLTTLADRIGLAREVEFILVSAVEGVSKPDPRIFRRALARAGVRPPEALHVGDSLREDYHGARDAGLRALLLERTGRPPVGVSAVRSLRTVIATVEGTF